jgi:hypothetical protein
MSAPAPHNRDLGLYIADSSSLAVRNDEDAAIDAWLASLTTVEFEQILDFFLNPVCPARPTLERSA